MRSAPTPKPIVSVAAVKGLLPVRDGSSKFDARIGLSIRTASSQIEAALDRRLTGGAYVDLFRTAKSGSFAYDLLGSFNEDGLRREVREQRFTLTAPNVSTSASFDVRYDPRRIWGDDTLINPELYTVDFEKGLLFLSADTAPIMDALRVAYQGGFNQEEVGDDLSGDGSSVTDAPPEPIQMATIAQAIHLFGRMAPDAIGVEDDRGAGKVGASRFTNRGGLCPEAGSLILSSGLRFVKVGSG